METAGERSRRIQVLLAGGVPTKELDQSRALNFQGIAVTKEGRAPAAFMVHSDFLAELISLNKTSADVDLVARDTPKQKTELATVFGQLRIDQSLDILGTHLNVAALDRVLLGQGRLDRFRVNRRDSQTGLEVIDYYLPCFDDKTGRIALIRLDLETKGQLQDAALKRSGEKLTQTDSRLNLPASIRVIEETRTVNGINHPIKIESATGELTFAGRAVTVESGSTIGGREGVDEDYSLLRQFNIPGIGEVMVANVKDGMGGVAAGERASETAAQAEINLLIELSANPNSPYHIEINRLSQAKYGGDRRAALVDLVISTQAKAVYDERIKTQTDMGTTTTEYFIFPDAIYSANVGDSSGYLNSGSGEYRITDAHSLVERLVSAGQITPEQALVHPQKNLIFRSLGDKPEITVDIKKIGFPNGEFSLLVCCDGITGSVGDKSGGKYKDGKRANPAEWFSPQIADALKANPSRPADVIASAVAAGKVSGCIDNTTYMRLKFSAKR